MIIGSHIVFISILGLLNRSLQPKIWLSYSPIFFPTYFLNFRWFTFSFHIWSVIHDFSISPRTNAFRRSSSLTLSKQHVSPLYILPQLHRMDYTQFLVKLYFVGGLNLEATFSKIEPPLKEETLKESRRTHRPKRCEYHNKDEDNSPNTLNDRNHQASSKKFDK